MTQHYIRALQAHRPDLPVALNDVIQRATAKDPFQCYRSALEFAAALHHASHATKEAPLEPGEATATPPAPSPVLV